MANNTNQPQLAAVYDKHQMFKAYYSSVSLIRRDWDALATLFGDERRRTYLKKNYPALEDTVSPLLRMSIYMGIAHLFDPLETGAKSNLVLQRVINDLGPPAGMPLRAQIDAEYKAMEPLVQKVKEWRNVAGAHRDLQRMVALVDHVEAPAVKLHPLPFIGITELHAGLERLVNITDMLFEHVYGRSEPWYLPAVVDEANRLFALVNL